MYLVLLLVVIYLCRSVVKRSRSKHRHHTIFFCQYICDGSYPAVLAKNREETRVQDIARRREEYVEWINNCNKIFEDKNKPIHTDRKVCRRTIDGVA